MMIQLNGIRGWGRSSEGRIVWRVFGYDKGVRFVD